MVWKNSCISSSFCTHPLKFSGVRPDIVWPQTSRPRAAPPLPIHLQINSHTYFCLNFHSPFYFHDYLGNYFVRPCKAPCAGVKPQYSRRWPGFLETPRKTPLPGAMQPSARSLTPWLGGYSFGTIPRTLSANAYLDINPYSTKFIAKNFFLYQGHELGGPRDVGNCN